MHDSHDLGICENQTFSTLLSSSSSMGLNGAQSYIVTYCGYLYIVNYDKLILMCIYIAADIAYQCISVALSSEL